MNHDEVLAARFEEHRARLRAVAYRMLGSPGEADDAVQEAWLRFSRTDTAAVENLGSWLTTVVSRVCLTMLQARRSRPEVPFGEEVPEPTAGSRGGDPEAEAVLADSIGRAMLIVLDTLTPAERVAFVLHDMFAVPFEEIAPVLGKTAPAARQLASRARRRVHGQPQPAVGSGRRQQSTLVSAFLAAARQGDFAALLAVLDPGVVLRADEAAVKLGAAAQVSGAPQVVASFAGRARGAVPALVDGAAGAVWMVAGRPRVVFSFTISAGKITGIDLIADPARLQQIDLVAPAS